MVAPENAEIVIYSRSDGGVDTIRTQIIDSLRLIESELTTAVTPDILTDSIDKIKHHGHAFLDCDGLAVVTDLHGNTSIYDELMRVIETPDSSLRHLVVCPGGGSEVSSLIESGVAAGVHVHVPGGHSGRVASGVESDVLDRRAGAGESWSGRPPLGFEVSEGHLVQGADYGRTVAVLRLVQQGDLSKRSAADELGVSRRTINRCLDNPDRYGLD